jgi:RNA polymerase sigma factor (sigma-70 family)
MSIRGRGSTLWFHLVDVLLKKLPRLQGYGGFRSSISLERGERQIEQLMTHTDNPTDSEVVRLVLAGDKAAFRVLLERYRSYVYQVAFSVLKEPRYAEDAAQEAFVKLYYALPQYEHQGFKTWLTRIALNQAIDVKRKLQRQREDPVDWTEAEPAAFSDSPADSDALRNLGAEELRQKLGDMPDSYRQVVHAYYFEDLSYQEIAKKHSVAVKTVESQLYRARLWMRKHWKEEDFR